MRTLVHTALISAALVLMALVAADGRQRPAPYVQGDEAVFVAEGTPADPPSIVADFNGWNPGAGVMRRVADGSYELRVRLHRAARIEYLIAYRERFEVDPRNPLRVPAPTGAPRSELRMPGYRPPAAVPPPAVAGLTERFPFTSKSGESRLIRVHRPRQAKGPLPVLYVHDGIIAAEELGLPAMIDALVGAGRMAPIAAVFINSIDRHEDYAAGSMFGYVFTGEIVPAIERKYDIRAGERSVLGLSRSTVAALDAALTSGVPFKHCGLLAPAVRPQTGASILKQAREARPPMTILAGTYDVPLIEEARTLREALQSAGMRVEWIETPEGHNHTAWKGLLPRLLASWFPPASTQ